jgi:hypothetical protein
LPKSKVITGLAESVYMICLSELGRIDVRRVKPDLNGLAPSMVSLKCRYKVDKLSFQRLDKFLVRAGRFFLNVMAGFAELERNLMPNGKKLP